MKKRFIKNAAFLTVSALITRSAGILFRIYSTGKIGSVGIGLLSLVMTVYMFCITVTTSAFNLAATRLVTDSFAEDAPGRALFALKRCLGLCIGVSTVIAVLMFLLSNIVAGNILKDMRCVLPLKILAFSLPFVSVSACLRGYFFARRRAFFTASEQVLEQVVEIAVFALLIDKMLPLGIEYGCCAIVLGTAAAEVISCFYSAALYIADVRKLGVRSEKTKGFFRKFFAIGLPVTASSCLRSGLSMAENVMIPEGLSKYGADREASLSRYGEIVGLAMPLLTFPDIFLYCFTTLMIPEMSDAKIKNRVNGIRHMAERVFGVSCAFSIGAAVFFYYFGAELGTLVFANSDVGLFIKLLAPIVPLIYMDRVVDGMLKGLGEQLHYLIYNIVDSVVRVTLTFFLLPMMGVWGVVVVFYVSAIINSGMSMLRLIKVAKINVDFLKKVVMPTLCAAAICLLLCRASFAGEWVTLIFRAAAFIITYATLNIYVFDRI